MVKKVNQFRAIIKNDEDELVESNYEAESN